jgi:hypothetical protein
MSSWMRILKIHLQVYFYPCTWCILVQITSHLFNTKLKKFLYRSTGRSGPIILTGTGTGKEKTLPVPSMCCVKLIFSCGQKPWRDLNRELVMNRADYNYLISFDQEVILQNFSTTIWSSDIIGFVFSLMNNSYSKWKLR